MFRFSNINLVRTWPVAAAALGGLLVLIASSVTTTSRKTEEMFIELERLNTHHRKVESVLRRLRSDVHLSGIFVRDYLLDTARSRAPEYREQLAAFRLSHAATLRELRALSARQDLPKIEKLAHELNDYWEAFEPLFDWTPAEKIARSASFLRRDVLPRRDAVLAIAKEIEVLNDANRSDERVAAERRRAEFRHDLHRRLWRSIAIGFIVTIVAVLRLRALEKRSDAQREVAERAEHEMRLLSQQLVAAQEEERKRLSRDLHDQVGQMLTALRMELGRAGRSRSVNDTQVREALSESKMLVDTILRSVRDLLMGLRPSMLDDFGLQPALEWHIREFSRRYQFAVDLDVAGDLGALPDQHRTAVYRIVQEALTNCARHARATRATVTVRYDEGRVALTVADDGSGFDPAGHRGMGLLGIEERVRELDGQLEVKSGHGSGTSLHVFIPVYLTASEGALANSARR